jgi:cell division protein FtsI/penicillin-binding protein 2
VPSYDPNRYASYRNERTTNWALSTVYEPGSTFKILTVASALEEDAIDEDFTFLDEGTLDVGGVTIHNHDFEPGSEPRKLDLTGLFRHSSNTAAAHIALRMPPEAFRSRLRRFGIGRKTGISLPGESAGVLRPASDWEELDLATTGFGQGMVAVTPLQMAAAVATIANDGKWLPPTLTASRSGHSRGRRAISERVAETILESLTQASTEDGPQVGNLAIAGKTGTAQKFCRAQGTYCRNQTIASYVGLFPVPEPRFLVLVVVDSPRAAGGWGNTVAMPIFEEIARDVWMRYPRLREERFSL